ncbi:MAG: DNA replication and repair protein RecF [Gemmatimonadetes bacterium]|nr:DNA replication and repair protein RecF [Gemmatimonadota bacterium]
MELSRLTVRNFRNLAALDLELPSRGVVIIGENGQGKTNLLEAIYYLVLFRSFRGAKDRELVRFDEAGFFLAGESNDRVTAGFDAHRRRKKVTVAGREVKQLGQAVGRIVAVVLSPADRDIVAAGPARRRRYLDVLLSLSEPAYLRALTAMRAALRQRNAALRRGQAQAAWAFDIPFATAARVIGERRRLWVEEQAERYAQLCTELGERMTPAMAYQPHGGHDAARDDLEASLAVARERDLRRGMTTVGPHRDDLKLTLGGRDMRHYGSAGQQRTAAIALRLLEAESLRGATGTAPVALFDDVFAELDSGRQERLLALIGELLPGQSIITAPRDVEVPAALFDRPRWQISGGSIAQ